MHAGELAADRMLANPLGHIPRVGSERKSQAVCIEKDCFLVHAIPTDARNGATFPVELVRPVELEPDAVGVDERSVAF
ncbi:hypothetical protein A244_39283 [Pseudomonas syringae pv. actinidiae ICMP 18807]|uniref:Uncharacterized protein n=1 Tax=Pseudomonas syringae pv. actinidiae ICMP 18807 TaxID=1194404 RepID=S6SGP2_PSESF|nr:hypothetical protein A244_39283 [Pseudomonas syringae pv. actinidiae ICMP 18807]